MCLQCRGEGIEGGVRDKTAVVANVQQKINIQS